MRKEATFPAVDKVLICNGGPVFTAIHLVDDEFGELLECVSTKRCNSTMLEDNGGRKHIIDLNLKVEGKLYQQG